MGDTRSLDSGSYILKLSWGNCIRGECHLGFQLLGRQPRRRRLRSACGGFLKLGVPFWGPHNKDYSILGSILGSAYLGKLPRRLCLSLHGLV